MGCASAEELIANIYAQAYRAKPVFGYPRFPAQQCQGKTRAALGYRRGDAGAFFLEAYLDAPVEIVLETAFVKARVNPAAPMNDYNLCAAGARSEALFDRAARQHCRRGGSDAGPSDQTDRFAVRPPSPIPVALGLSDLASAKAGRDFKAPALDGSVDSWLVT